SCEWSSVLPGAAASKADISVSAGGQERIPIEFALPAALAPGQYTISAKVSFSTGETQTDSFRFEVFPSRKTTTTNAKFALFDPKGETRAALERAGIHTVSI